MPSVDGAVADVEDDDSDVDVSTRCVFLPRAARKGSNILERKELKEFKVAVAASTSSSSSTTSLTVHPTTLEGKSERVARIMDRLRD